MSLMKKKIEMQGELVRKLKSQNAKVTLIRSAVDKLVSLKNKMTALK